ncbi:glutamate cyclase domain-containing protein [Aestuariirhabdus sp. LZHN29]|uniref:glutamate cyclase domain-containing protein n=1 Tax=Aestuariirhabdus sp. LZHN29 TaxID=3417462 RepID=UPI003CE8B6C5
MTNARTEEMKLTAEAELALSYRVEDLLVARNLRGMKTVQPALEPGYCLRAAHLLRNCRGVVLIGTGFPVVDTFETDGPVGALALYHSLEALGAEPIIVCGAPISRALATKYRVHEIRVGDHSEREQEAKKALSYFQPEAIISIERPGMASDGEYYNMRGESISARTACFDTFMIHSDCPTIAIGDGGNEIGMGNVSQALKMLDITPAATGCDELIVADVSNWGAYGIITFLSRWSGVDLLAMIKPLQILQYLSALGSVDGVTRVNELTEDGLVVEEGESLLLQLRRVSGFEPADDADS